jgi:hypothetical protein
MLRSAGSVRFQFFTAFGIVAVMLWGAIAFALHTAERETMAKASVEGGNLARSLAEHVASSVGAIDLVLLHLRAELIESSEPAAARVAREQKYLKLEFVSQVTLVDAEGRIAWTSLPGWQGVDVSDRPHFKVLKQHGADGLYISEPVLERVSKQWTIQFTRPIYDRRQKFAGVLVLSVPPPALERVYNDIELGAGTIITLVRADGQILAHTHDLAKAATVSLTEVPGLGPNAAAAGEARSKGKIDGVERLYRYQKVRGYPLTVIVGQSIDTVLARYRAQRAIYLALGALTTILLPALMLLLVSRRIDKDSADQYHARLAAIVQGSSDAIVGLDHHGRIVSWNTGAERLYGYTEAEAVGQPFPVTVPADRLSEFAALPRRIFQGEQVQHFETVCVTKDGRRIDVRLGVSAIKNADGGVVGISAIAQDITARKRRDEDLRRFRVAMDATADAIYLVDRASMRFIDVNEAACRMQSRTREELLALGPDGVLSTSREELERIYDSVIAGSVRTEPIERQRLRKDGSPIWLELHRSAQRSDNGWMIVTVARDITERKRAEEEIRRLNESLEQKVTERTRELEISNEELGAFSYSVAHDLRTPLRGISGFSAILAAEYAGKLDATALGYLQRIQAATIRMSEVMDDLLALAHAGRAEIKREDVDLSALAQAVAATLERSDPQRQVEFAIAPGMAADADLRLMRIALENLLGNAWKFTDKTEHAKIEFGIAEASGKPAFFVRDNGIGFDPAFSGKLFEQFQRLHTDKEYEGSGVGLAIVARVIRRHGGRIWAEGAVGQGAVFYFTLPYA